MAPHSSTLAWKIPWMEEPGGLQSMGSPRVGHNWATSLSLFTFHFHALEKEMATHSSVLAWRIPWTGEPGGLLSMGSHRVGHNWSDLATATVPISAASLWPTHLECKGGGSLSFTGRELSHAAPFLGCPLTCRRHEVRQAQRWAHGTGEGCKVGSKRERGIRPGRGRWQPHMSQKFHAWMFRGMKGTFAWHCLHQGLTLWSQQ